MSSQASANPQIRPDILVVEDQDVTRRALSLLLTLHGYSNAAVGSAEEALGLVHRDQCPEIVLADLDLPGMSGLDLICRLRQQNAGIFGLLLTAADESRIHAICGGSSVDYLQKPVNFDQLLTILNLHGKADALAI